jgi:hypothetical protein
MLNQDTRPSAEICEAIAAAAFGESVRDSDGTLVSGRQLMARELRALVERIKAEVVSETNGKSGSSC